MNEANNPPSAGTTDACLPPALRKPRLRRSEASQYLEVAHGLTIATATLAKLACIGGGPPFHKSGASPLYPRDLLDAWAVERLGKLLRSTSDAGGA
jgi:hypothetical protein